MKYTLKHQLMTTFSKFFQNFLLRSLRINCNLRILSSKWLLMKNVTFDQNLGNIRVLGQYRVSKIEEGSLKSCMNQTVCRPCQKFNRYYLTIANECILYSDEHLTAGAVEEVITYTSDLKVKYFKSMGDNFVAKIISGRT